MWRFIVLFYLAFTLSLAGAAQTKLIDSLRQDIYRARTDSEKLKAMLALCEEHQSMNRDTLDHYAVQAQDLALKSGNSRSIGMAKLAMAYDYMRWGWIDSALAELEPEIKKHTVGNDNSRDIYFKLARQQAMCYGQQSVYKNALAILYEIVSQAERYKDSAVLGANYNTIGSIAIARGQANEAMQWFEKALAVSPDRPVFWRNRAAIFTNMANAYYASDKKDSSQYCLNISLPLARRVENLNTLATALRIQSNVYIHSNKLAQAEQALKEMIEVRQSTNLNTSLVVDDNLLLVDFYNSTGQTKRAIEMLKQWLQTGDLYAKNGEGKVFNNKTNIRLLYYEALANCYKQIGNNALYQQTLENLVAAKDSFYEANSAEAIAELQTRYEVQKKENTIIQQKLDLVKKNNLLYGTLGFLFFICVIGWLVFSNYKKRQRLKLELLQEEEKLRSKEAVKEAEEKERKRIAADLHDNLGVYAASVVSNLEFIQQESMDKQSVVAMQELRNNSRAMVSQLSDTIWVLKKDELSLTGISDRVKVFVQRLQPSYPNVTIEVLEQLDEDVLLPSTHAYHLFRIIQEAANNALKHSKCTRINIMIANNRIEVTDNGIGMPETHHRTPGNGLANMQERAALAGWNISWEKAAGGGTQVIITQPEQ
ncbi:tetratricopeptide repeat-containing sensor histidine kinase [Foetidibacter luteolus]|uniref:tetratricopeptide repeat-containing sensor histidine kinase n=1 Tax=Foetidibacter luteolus TaxID=2608880 RepID=UPI00129B331F|nr:ATP-binding protein [Foetidibacter luteolus]